MECKRIYEFLLWNNCNNNCQFCFQKHHRHEEKFLDENQRVESMFKAVQLINSDTFIPGSHVLLVGGELFDTKFSEGTERVFRSLFCQMIHWMLNGHIDLLYINTNLLYTDTTYLTKYLLEPIKKNNLFDRLKFTTSYDLYGRFTKDRPASLVEHNLQKIVKKYPDIHIVVNMIMTKQFCEAVLSGTFSVKNFKTKYGVSVNTIPYIILTEDMAPTREQIYSTLAKLDADEPGYVKDYVHNIALPQEKLLYEYNGKEYVFMTAANSPCGHNENFKMYTPTKDRCFVCDMIDLGELYV